MTRRILRVSFIFFASIFSLELLAQQGTIRGTVFDDANGESLFGVTVVLQDLMKGSVTDFDGKYEIKVEPGTYNIQVSFVSFNSVTIKDLEVKAGQTTLLDVRLKESVEQLAEVVITAEAIKTTEEALLTVKMRSPNLLDGISSANFKKIGDGDAASAIKRVTGVSVEGGKYVYVRGLGDRYTKSILNGMDIPGLDPDRNTLQMDIFPTSILDNIIVLKSFTADLPADFTGGVVNIATKDFPEEKTLSVSGSLGYNPSMHFNNNYLTYAGGGKDWLGFDDGSRAIPTANLAAADIPFRTQALVDPAGAGVRFNGVLNDFNPTMGAMKSNSLMDYSLGISSGDQKTIKGITLGYNASLSYKSSTTFYQDAQYNRYGKNQDKDITQLDQREFQRGDIGINDVLVAGMLGFAIKTQNSKFIINGLHLQNGESRAAIFDYEGSDFGANFTSFQHNLDYSQRSLTNLLVNGVHYFSGKDWEIDWKFSPSKSSLYDPDIRFTRYRTDGTNLDVLSIGTESGIPERIWRDLNEENIAGRFDVTRKYSFAGQTAKVKFGSGYSYKHRDYIIENFQIFAGNTRVTGNPDELFFPENLWAPDNRNGVYYDAQFVPVNTNQYDASIENMSFYASNEADLVNNLKTVIGVRVEQYNQFYTGRNQQGDIFDNSKVLDNLDVFPTANFIYSLTDRQNLRFSFAKTVARPSFKEASFAEIVDPLTGRTFIGGFFTDVDLSTGEIVWDGKLSKTDISNFDLRWELFQKSGQMFSVSGFYKMFTNPIEMVQFLQATNNFQPRNVGDGSVLGLELETRQNLGRISTILENFSFAGNVTITESRIEMSETEFSSRVLASRTGENIKKYRNMAGQAPYIINAGLSYQSNKSDLEAGVYYNVQGSTLNYVGIGTNVDIYSVPFHSLNFNVTRSFGSENRVKMSLKAENILGDDREEVFRNFESRDEIFTSLRPQRSFSLGFSYAIF